MKTKDIRELSLNELDKKIRDTRETLLNLRLRKQTGQVERPSELRSLRRDIARMQTVRRDKASTAA